MPIDYFTGFEGCGSNEDVTVLLSGRSHIAGTWYDATNGYGGGKCLRVSNSGYSFNISNFTANTTKIVGFHVKGLGTHGYNAFGINRHLLRFTIGTGSNYIRVFNTAENGIEVYRDATLLCSSTNNIGTGLTHCEMKLVSHSTAGEVHIKVNGESVISETNLNTHNDNITDIYFGSCNTSNVYYDNIFIADDWQGELISYLRKPESDASVQFTPNSGSDNYSRVNQSAPDGDTTYVSSNTLGHTDIYGVEDMPTGVTVKAVAVGVVARKDDAGDRALELIAKKGTDEVVSDEIFLGTDYPAVEGGAQRIVFNKAPNNTDWSVAKFNDTDFGFKVST